MFCFDPYKSSRQFPTPSLVCNNASSRAQVLDELRHLEDFFTSQNRQARQPMVGLYEQAQACTMVLPRLYLLNTVGACYILSKEAPARVSWYHPKIG